MTKKENEMEDNKLILEDVLSEEYLDEKWLSLNQLVMMESLIF